MANTALPVTAPEGTSTYRFLTAPVLLVITPLPVRPPTACMSAQRSTVPASMFNWPMTLLYRYWL